MLNTGTWNIENGTTSDDSFKLEIQRARKKRRIQVVTTCAMCGVAKFLNVKLVLDPFKTQKVT